MNKSTILLLAFLVVLGAIVLFVLPKDEDQIASYDRKPVAFTVDSAAVVKLSVERAGKRLVVENVGGRWTLTSHGNVAADPARVAEVIGGLSRFKSGSLVSTNPSKQGVFQVDSSGNLVTLTERSGAEPSIIIGKMGPSFSEVYFRLPGRPEVYLGSGITTWSLEREAKDWRDRTIFAAPAEAITGLELSAGGRTREFRKDSTGWKSGRDAVPTETINPVITALADLRAEDFIDSAVQFTGAPSTVRVSGGVAATLDFYRIAGDTARYAVGTTSSTQKYIVGRYPAAQLFKPVGDPRSSGVAALRKGAAPPAGEETARVEETKTVPAPPESEPARPPAQPPSGASKAAKPTVPPAGTEKARAGETAKETPKVETKEPAKQAAPPPAPATGGAVNPFKQKSATERAAQPPPVTTSPSGQSSKSTAPADTRKGADQQQKPPATPPAQTPAQTQQQSKPSAQPPAKPPAGAQGADDEGELTVHVVQKGESMTTIAQKYGVSVEQILKWNLLKSIAVKPGQELYIFLRK